MNVMEKGLRRMVLAAALLSMFAALPPMMPGGSAAAAQARGPVQRTVVGKVQGKDGTGIKGAVVYLKDTRSTAVKSAIADDDGSYRFVQLSPATDYEIYAKSDGKTSKSRSISSFDTRNDFTINLKID